jgi:hypothetical protein
MAKSIDVRITYDEEEGYTVAFINHELSDITLGARWDDSLRGAGEVGTAVASALREAIQYGWAHDG